MLLLLLAILLSVGELTAASYCVQDCSSTGLKLRTVNTRNATITLDAGGNSAPSIIFKLEGTEAARLDSSGLNLKTDLNMNLNQITAAAIRNDGFIYSESAAGAIRFAPGTGNATLQVRSNSALSIPAERVFANPFCSSITRSSIVPSCKIPIRLTFNSLTLHNSRDMRIS